MRILLALLLCVLLATTVACKEHEWRACDENSFQWRSWKSDNTTYVASRQCGDFPGKYGTGWTKCVNNFQNTSWIEDNVFYTGVRYCEEGVSHPCENGGCFWGVVFWTVIGVTPIVGLIVSLMTRDFSTRLPAPVPLQNVRQVHKN